MINVFSFNKIICIFWFFSANKFDRLRAAAATQLSEESTDGEDGSMVIAANSSNPHEAMREYARKKRKDTKWEPGYFERHPVSHLIDISLSFDHKITIF